MRAGGNSGEAAAEQGEGRPAMSSDGAQAACSGG